MKLVIGLLVVLGVTLVTAAGCSVSHRSGDFACEKQSDCSTGRVCSEGFCVVLDSGANSDAAVCPAQCTSCIGGTRTCAIDCATSPDVCTRPITCPAGWSCNILCSQTDSCRSGISCDAGKSCMVTCSGRRSCQSVTCGAGPCNVDCAGPMSCAEVSCGTSCACGVSCSAIAACGTLACNPGPGCGSARSCTAFGVCDMCP